MPKFVVQEGVTLFHNGETVKAGAIIELTMEQAARKIARGDIKLTAGKAAAAKPEAKPTE
jgi:hypothetical protein